MKEVQRQSRIDRIARRIQAAMVSDIMSQLMTFDKFSPFDQLSNALAELKSALENKQGKWWQIWKMYDPKRYEDEAVEAYFGGDSSKATAAIVTMAAVEKSFRLFCKKYLVEASKAKNPSAGDIKDTILKNRITSKSDKNDAAERCKSLIDDLDTAAEGIEECLEWWNKVSRNAANAPKQWISNKNVIEALSTVNSKVQNAITDCYRKLKSCNIVATLNNHREFLQNDALPRINAVDVPEESSSSSPDPSTPPAPSGTFDFDEFKNKLSVPAKAAQIKDLLDNSMILDTTNAYVRLANRKAKGMAKDVPGGFYDLLAAASLDKDKISSTPLTTSNQLESFLTVQCKTHYSGLISKINDTGFSQIVQVEGEVRTGIEPALDTKLFGESSGCVYKLIKDFFEEAVVSTLGAPTPDFEKYKERIQHGYIDSNLPSKIDSMISTNLSDEKDVDEAPKARETGKAIQKLKEIIVSAIKTYADLHYRNVDRDIFQESLRIAGRRGFDVRMRAARIARRVAEQWME